MSGPSEAGREPRPRAHDQDNAFGNGAFERDNGLAGLAEPHVVGKERALFRQKKRHPVGLVRVEQTWADRRETFKVRYGYVFHRTGPLLPQYVRLSRR
jgi:hypothetical protein